MTTAHREPDAEVWAAVARDRLPDPAAVAEVADALADLADPAGWIDPAPTVAALARAAGRPRLAVRRSLSALIAAGLLAVPDNGTARLTLPEVTR